MSDYNTKQRLCTIDSCERKHHARGYCKTHYNYWWKNGVPTPPPKQVRLCEVSGCTKKHSALGYCEGHYSNYRKHGKPVVRAMYCTYKDCESKHYAKGFCVKHYNRWRTHGDPSKVVSRKIIGKCKVEDCQRDIYCRGYCTMHYQRLMNNGNPLTTKTNRTHDGICMVKGCENDFFAKNMCYKHYMRDYSKVYNRSVHGREVNRLGCQRRRAKKASAPINDFTVKQWRECLDYFNNECAYCGMNEDTLNQEHVIPISKGGSHTKTNIIPSCGVCNSHKGARTIHEWYSSYEHYDENRKYKILKYLEYTVSESEIQLQLF